MSYIQSVPAPDWCCVPPSSRWSLSPAWWVLIPAGCSVFHWLLLLTLSCRACSVWGCNVCVVGIWGLHGILQSVNKTRLSCFSFPPLGFCCFEWICNGKSDVFVSHCCNPCYLTPLSPLPAILGHFFRWESWKKLAHTTTSYYFPNKRKRMKEKSSEVTAKCLCPQNTSNMAVIPKCALVFYLYLSKTDSYFTNGYWRDNHYFYCYIESKS